VPEPVIISAFCFFAVPCRNAVEAEQVKTFFRMAETGDCHRKAAMPKNIGSALNFYRRLE